MSSLQLGSFLK